MINESVPVYEDNFRLLQDVVVSADRTFVGSVSQAKTITLKGTLFYQACDLVKCYLHQKSGVSRMCDSCHWMERDLRMRFGISKFNRVGEGVRG